MRLGLTSSLALALVLGACGGDPNEAGESVDVAPASAATSTEATEAALDEVRTEWARHFNLGHADMVADLYHDSATFISANHLISEGREAIAAGLAETIAMGATVEVMPGERMVFGDVAVQHGAYAMTMSPEGGEAMEMGGSYFTVLTDEDGEWKIRGHMSNYSAAPPAGTEMAPFPGPEDRPADSGTMSDLEEAFETHYNLGHPEMVADLFTEDGVSMFANGAPQTGRDAIAADLTTRLAGSPQVDIHDVGTMELDDGWALDWGWYEITAGDMTRQGFYNQLLRQAEDGSWQIQWLVSN